MGKYLKPPKIAIIGCGNIGSKLDENKDLSYALSHAGAYQKMGQDISFLVDIDKDRLLTAAKTRGVQTTYTSYDELFNNEEIDILSICSSTNLREAIFIRALESKIPVIICEKPIASNYDEAIKIKSLVENSSSTCILNYSRRWDEDVQQIKKIIASGELGKMTSAQITYGKGILNNASHALNLLDFFIESEKDINFVQRINDDRIDFDAAYNVMMTYRSPDNQFPVILKATDHRNFTLWEIDLLFSKGRITFENSGLTKKIYNVVDSPVFEGYRILNLDLELSDGYLPCMENMITESLQIFNKQKKSSRSSISDALQSMTLIEKIKNYNNEY